MDKTKPSQATGSSVGAPESGKAGARGGYLYGQQIPEDKPRRSRRGPAPKRPKPTGSHQAGHRFFLSNVRTFLLVILGMTVIALMAWGLAHQVEQARLRRNQRDIKEYELGVAQIEAQRPKGPLQLLEQELEVQSDPEVPLFLEDGINIDTVRKALYHRDLARDSLKRQNYPEAIERFKQALELAPYMHEVWAELGWSYLEVQDPSRAQVALERAVEGKPDDPETLCHLGLAYLNLQQYDKAQSTFETAMQVDPAYPLSNFYLAKCYLRQLDLDQAVIYLERYLRVVPTDSAALRDRAYIYANRKQYNQALDNLRKAIAERPDWDELYWDAAAVSALLGRVEDAIRYMETGEAFTDPSSAYKVWRRPPFDIARQSAAGKIYERELAERARRLLQSGAGG